MSCLFLYSGLDQVDPTGAYSPQEADLEDAFRRSVQQDDEAAVGPLEPGLTLDTAVQQLDIDNLLKKLVCGDLKYNPHDPHRYMTCSQYIWAYRLAVRKQHLQDGNCVANVTRGDRVFYVTA